MAEVLFYHLTERTLEQVLPGLVEKCLERQWRAVIQAGSRERLEAIDSLLWTFREDSFLPHAMERDGSEHQHPVWLTTEGDNPNQSQVRFLVDGAVPPDLGAYLRGVYLFDGHDADALSQARERWKAERAAGHDVTYWQQAVSGRWEKRV